MSRSLRPGEALSRVDPEAFAHGDVLAWDTFREMFVPAAPDAGPTGATGATGPPGAGMIWLGAFDDELIYEAGDGVELAGSSYLALVTTPHAPPHADWSLFAAQGATGATGAAGSQGVQGDPGDTGAEGPAGDTGGTGLTGPTGDTGAPGPNTVTGATSTTLTGFLKGNGANVSAVAAIAAAEVTGTAVVTADARLSDTRVPTDLSATNAKLAQMATKTYKGRTSGGTGAPEDVAVATVKTDLVLVKGDVGLGNVDNTTDAGKPVSTATQTALDLKANLASPTFSGTVVLPAATVTLAMQANMATASLVYRKTAGAGVPEVNTLATLKTDLVLVKGDVGLGNVDNTTDAGKPVSTAQQTALNLKADLASPTFTGTPSLPTGTTGTTQAAADSTTKLATTAFATTADNLKANLASPTFTGTPALPTGTTGITQAAADSSTKLATTEFTTTADNLKANLASPTFTGTVTLPAVTLGDTKDIAISNGTGSKIGQSTSKIGFFGATPVVQPSALTQTYSTASATHAAVTQLVPPAGGTGTAAGGYDTAANRNLMITSLTAARTDIANLKNFVNQIVDQLQALGLLT